MATIKNTITIDTAEYLPGIGRAWEDELVYTWENWLDETWENQI